MFNKDCYLDHVAIAVSHLDQAQKIWENIGLTFNSEREEVPSQQVTTAFAHIGEQAHLELVSPINNEGPIQKFIEKNGEGIHHMCFKVLDVVKKTEELKKMGFKMIYETPVIGANQCLVNFIHPKSTGGVLVEISTSQKI